MHQYSDSFFLGISYSLPVIFFCSLPLETKFSCKRKEEKGVPICQKYFQFKSATMFSCKGNRKRSSNLSKIHFRFNSKVQQGIEKNSWLTKKPFKNNAKKKSYETFHISLLREFLLLSLLSCLIFNQPIFLKVDQCQPHENF